MKNNNLIAVNGKINSGKDTVGNIIQILTALPHLTDKGVESFLGREIDSPYKIKKFADKLKDIVCLLIGCTRDQLECREFKEKELGEEWWYWVIVNHYNQDKALSPIFTTRKEAQQWEQSQTWYEDTGGYDTSSKLIKLTPRLFLQLLGTEAGRNIIHPNIWVNSLFSDYKSNLSSNHPVDDLDWEPRQVYPKWCITDLRFPNEFEAVKDRSGITIKVNREIKHQVETLGGRTNVPKGYFPTNQHPSETALDQETRWDYVIDNNSTIEDLIKKVREILNKENII